MELPSRRDTETVVSELRTALGWQGVKFVDDSFVISFDMKHRKVIKGLEERKNTFALTFDSFNGLPISFYITMGNTVHQYWTINGQLHRTEDRPSYVSIDPTKDRVIRRWYRNGLLHREHGPAMETYTGYRVSGEDEFPEHFKEDWNLRTMSWYQEGQRLTFPYPYSAFMHDGWCTRHKKTKRLDSIQPDVCSQGAQFALVGWGDYHSMEPGKTTPHGFRPESLEVFDLMETYHDGVFINRECVTCDFTWRRDSQLISAQQSSEFNNQIRETMLSTLNLWGEPFYADDQAEVVLLAEFDRVGLSDG